MTARVPENIPFLYLAADDLYRIGSSESSKLDKVRAVDIDTYDRNGIQLVQANKKGISLFTEADLLRTLYGMDMEDTTWNGNAYRSRTRE
jgi:hypothetical protein